MQTGKLRFPCYYYPCVQTTLADNQVVDGEGLPILLWADITWQSGSEDDNNNVEDAVRIGSLYTRYHPLVDVKGKFRYLGRVFNIRSVINVGELNKELMLVITERV